MDSIICNNELQPRQILDLSKTYLKTPYYKTIPEFSLSGPTLAPQYNYSNYDKFCLERNLEPIFTSLKLTFELSSKHIGDKMVLCVTPLTNGSIFEMSEKTQYTLQSEIDYICSTLYHLCLLYDVSTDNRYPKNWLYNIINSLQISNSLNPSFINGYLYLSLNEFEDYDEIYSNAFDALMIQISQLYNTGSLVCDQDFARRWNLQFYRGNLYIADWIDSRISNEKSLFLINLYLNPVTTLNIPHNYYIYHYLSKLIKLPLIDTGVIQLKLDSYQDIIQILTLTDELQNQSLTYSLSLIPVSSLEIYEEYKIKILKKYKSVDISVYKTPNSQNPLILSVYSKKEIPELQQELESYLNLNL